MSKACTHFEIVNLATGTALASSLDWDEAKRLCRGSCSLGDEHGQPLYGGLGVRCPNETWDVCAIESERHRSGELTRAPDGKAFDYDPSVDAALFTPEFRAWLTTGLSCPEATRSKFCHRGAPEPCAA